MSPTNGLHHRFIELLTVDSTNNYAMRLVHEGMAQHGTVVFTHEQTKGKGQRGKHWVATPNENIMLSLIVDPFKLSIDQQFFLSMSAAIGVQSFFSQYAGEETKIKWPNDLYWRDRKAGGILIENVITGSHWKYAIIGIGININQTRFEQINSKAVSLRQITGKSFDTLSLAKELIAYLDKAFEQLVENREEVLNQYQLLLYKRFEQVRLKKANRIFETTIKGVQKDGCLITNNGLEETFAVGEIEWLLK